MQYFFGFSYYGILEFFKDMFVNIELKDFFFFLFFFFFLQTRNTFDSAMVVNSAKSAQAKAQEDQTPKFCCRHSSRKTFQDLF